MAVHGLGGFASVDVIAQLLGYHVISRLTVYAASLRAPWVSRRRSRSEVRASQGRGSAGGGVDGAAYE